MTGKKSHGRKFLVVNLLVVKSARLYAQDVRRLRSIYGLTVIATSTWIFLLQFDDEGYVMRTLVGHDGCTE